MNTNRHLAALLLFVLASVAAFPARAELVLAANSEQATYVRGRTNTFRFAITLRSASLEGGDSISFGFPEGIAISATRLIQASSICSDQYLLALGMGERVGGWFTSTHPSGCGYFASSAEGVVHTVEVDADIPADFVGDLRVAVTAEGDVCCDGFVHEATVEVPFVDDGSVVTFAFDGDPVAVIPHDWSAAASEPAVAWHEWPEGVPNRMIRASLATHRAEAQITTPPLYVPAGGAELRFRHFHSMEAGRDGGVLELAIDEGPFLDVEASGAHFLFGGYTQTLASDPACPPEARNPLEGRAAWTGSIGGFATVVVGVPAAMSGHRLRARWRAASDCTGEGGEVWGIEDVQLVPSVPIADVQPASLHMALGPDRQSMQRLRIANPGGGLLTYAVSTGTFGAGDAERVFADGFDDACASAAPVSWLRASSRDDALYGTEEEQIDVDIDTRGLESGPHSAFVCVVTSDPQAPRIAVPFDVQVDDACPSDEIACGGRVLVYSRRDAFMRQIADGYNAQSFTGLRATDVFSPIAFGGENFGFGAFTAPDAITPRLRLFGGSGVLSTANPLDRLAFTFEGQAVNAVGGTFFGEIFEGFGHQSRRLPAAIELRLDDGTIERIPADDAEGFRGIVTDIPIRAFTVLGEGRSAEGDDIWGVVSDIVVGATR